MRCRNRTHPILALWFDTGEAVVRPRGAERVPYSLWSFWRAVKNPFPKFSMKALSLEVRRPQLASPIRNVGFSTMGGAENREATISRRETQEQRESKRGSYAATCRSRRAHAPLECGILSVGAAACSELPPKLRADLESCQRCREAIFATSPNVLSQSLTFSSGSARSKPARCRQPS
jgi:hypothetical protein